jgi:hypothetical protein
MSLGSASDSTCPGCGVTLPAIDWKLDRPFNASPECWQLSGEVIGFELNHPSLAGRFHQLTVDAYGAQHAGGDTGYIRAAYSLVGLYLAIEREMGGVDVRSAHQRMGHPDATWPPFPRPKQAGSVTILDVAEAGARAGSIEGHATLVQRWATDVWHAWADQHATVATLADRLLYAG